MISPSPRGCGEVASQLGIGRALETMAEQRTPSREKDSYSKAKRSSNQKDNTLDENGEYGFFPNETFCALCNFVLKCEGVVVEDGDIIGYMVRAKPKNNRNEDDALW